MSESKLWPALLRARSTIQRIPKTATNPHFGNSYTPLEDILAAVLPALRAEGLVLSSACSTSERGACLTVRVTCSETGEAVESAVPLVGCSDMQKLGGAMTYAARYGIAGLLALELEGTDDDGNTAARPSAAPPRPHSRPAQPSTAQARPEAQGRASAPAQGKDGFRPTKPVTCPTCGGTSVFPSSKVPGGYYCAQSQKYQGCGAQWDAAAWVKVKRGLAESAKQPGYGDALAEEAPPPDDNDLPF